MDEKKIVEVRKLVRCIDFHQSVCPPHKKDCGEYENCVECWTESLLALIAEDRAGLVEALQMARRQIARTLPPPKNLFNVEGEETLKAVDAAIEGRGK